jgi:hypothetical protein
MNAGQRITTILKEWLQLTRLESHAIKVGRWSELTRIQKVKTALQQPLIDAVEEWKTKNPAEATSNPFRHEISRLFDLESHDGELLAVRKREVREKILLLEQALSDLRHLRSSCAQATETA